MVYFQNNADVWTGDPAIDSLLEQDGCRLRQSNQVDPEVVVEDSGTPGSYGGAPPPTTPSGEPGTYGGSPEAPVSSPPPPTSVGTGSTRESLSMGLTFTDMNIADADAPFLAALCSVMKRLVAKGLASQGVTIADLSCYASARAGSVITTTVTTLPEKVSADTAEASVSAEMLDEVAADAVLSLKGAVSGLTVSKIVGVEDATTLFAPLPRIDSLQSYDATAADSAPVVVRQPSLLFGVAFTNTQGSVQVPLEVTGFDESDVAIAWTSATSVTTPPVSVIVTPRVTSTSSSTTQVSSYTLAVLAQERWPATAGCEHVTLAVSLPEGAVVGSNGLDSRASNVVLLDWYPGARLAGCAVRAAAGPPPGACTFVRTLSNWSSNTCCDQKILLPTY